MEGKTAKEINYERKINDAAWHWVCIPHRLWPNSTDVMEDWARDIAVSFDLPYLSVKEDLQTAINEWIIED